MIPDLSISIINTNNRAQVLDCLRSVFANTRQISLEVFVVDNACTDGSADAIAAEFPQVKLICNGDKLGFSTNNNLALSQASGHYLMLLNDDTVVLDSTFDRMVAFMDEHPEAGVVGAALVNPDGSYQGGYDYFPQPLREGLYPWSRFMTPGVSEKTGPTEVDWVCGACLMVRRQVVEQVGLLDPIFDPLYAEETDWCYRIHQHGWQIVYLPQARVIHYGSQTMNRTAQWKTESLRRHQAVFFRKHYGARGVWLFKVALFFSSLIKAIGWGFLGLWQRGAASQRAGLHLHMARITRDL